MSLPSVQAAALWTALMILVMLGLKLYVGGQRRRHKVPAGDQSNPAFGLASRVQMNAVEDVPPLMVGILALAMLNAPAVYIHACGGVLFVSRVLHAWGLASSSGFSIGRFVGTMGTLIATLMIVGGILARLFGLMVP